MVHSEVVKRVDSKSSHHKEKKKIVTLTELVVIISQYMYARFLCCTPQPIGGCMLIIALKNVFNKLEHLIIIGKALKDSEFLLWAVFVQLLFG